MKPKSTGTARWSETNKTKKKDEMAQARSVMEDHAGLTGSLRRGVYRLGAIRGMPGNAFSLACQFWPCPNPL